MSCITYGSLLHKRKGLPFKIYFFNRLSILIVSGFSFLGFAIGLLVGMSLSPVVQVVIPELLTFYGGFLTYIIAKESIAERQRYISVLLSAMAISFFLIYGIEIGSAERDIATKNSKDMDLYYMEKQEAIKKEIPLVSSHSLLSIICILLLYLPLYNV